METLVQILLVIPTLMVTLSSAYPTGAPALACGNLDPSPGHGPSTNQGPAPYALWFSETHYTPGKPLIVTLGSKDESKFMGFLVQAFPASATSSQSLGAFEIPDGALYHAVCSSKTGNGVTHKQATLKTNVTLTWTPPAGSSEDIVFHFTVVRGKTGASDYFKDLKSDVIKAANVEPSSNFPKDPGCGKTKGCYSNCKPDGTCDWLVSWGKHDNETVLIGLTSTISSDNKYVAVGFSERQGMAKASVVACHIQKGKVSAVASFNPGYYNTPLPNPTVDSAQGSFVSGVLTCTFMRKVTSSNPQIFNLTDPWYLITARGDLSPDGSLRQHDTTNCHVTNIKIDVINSMLDVPFNGGGDTTSQSPPTSSIAPAPAKTFKKDPACGVTKGCYSNCDDGVCDFLMSWKKQADHYVITLNSGFDSNDNNYVALGFSKAQKMYPASVVQCIASDGKVKASLSYNSGYSNQMLQANDQKLVTQVKNSFKDGVLSCTMTRPIRYNSSQVFDLDDKWYLISARGSVSGGMMVPHNVENRFLTTSQVWLEDTSVDISMEESSYPLIKLHGCLMVLAWILSASIGIAMARYFKPVWPDTTICGVKVWFAIHRSAMILAFCLGVTAIIVIFVETGGYCEIIGEDYKKAHPILGIVVTALLVINPFMSLLRCGPDHPQRPLFNWAHFLVGSSAHILSAITIAIGLYLPKAQTDGETGLIIIIIYGAWQVLFFCIMSALDFIAKNDSKIPIIQHIRMTSQKKSFPLENDYSTMSKINPTGESFEALPKQEQKMSSAKKWVLGFHIVVLVAVAVYLMYMIIDTDV